MIHVHIEHANEGIMNTSMLTYVLGAQRIVPINETILLSTNNICFV